MRNLKTTVYYLSESEKLLNGRLLKNQLNDPARSSDNRKKCVVMLHNFLNMLLKDELKMVSKLNDLNSSEIIINGESVFSDIMHQASIIHEKTKGNLDDEDLFNELSSDIVSLRFNYLALKSVHPNLF